MARKSPTRNRSRRRLTRNRILRAAIALLDEGGLEAVSMRNLGAALGTGAMSLYNHVTSKEDLLEGIADLVAREIHLPTPGTDWRTSMRQRAVSARELILRHPWVARLLESQSRLGGARLAALEAALASLRRAGFSVVAAYRSMLLLDSYIYGFTLQENAWRFDASAPADVAASLGSSVPPDAFPQMAEVLAHFVGGGAPSAPSGGTAAEFEVGLELVLDALASLRRQG